ncbi:MAG: ribonuclease J, partial [Candidatus Vogelbacteria bacterium]|nr:ribonuclease J [Candidatus Vogelbacteria bacterium]
MPIRRMRVDENGRVQTFVGQPKKRPEKMVFVSSRPAVIRPPKASSSRPHQNRKHFSSHHRNENEGDETKPREKIPELAPGNIRIIPLGGVEEVGKNMTAIEFGNDILVVDAGFLLPGEDVPGVDYVIADTTYLEERRSKVRAMLITHGHLDHIGGIPYLMEKIGNPPIYTSLLTAVMIKKRQEEFPNVPRLNIQVIESKDKVKLGELTVRFFDTTHTIPDSIGIIIETPYGNIIVTGDIKLESENNQ